MESAMKFSRQYFLEKSPPEPERTLFIARHQSFHGTTLGALSMGGHKIRRALFEPMLLGNVSHVSPCFSYRHQGSETVEVYVARLAAELDQEFQNVGPSKVIAFVAEPVVGAVSVILFCLWEHASELTLRNTGSWMRSVRGGLLPGHEGGLR